MNLNSSSNSWQMQVPNMLSACPEAAEVLGQGLRLTIQSKDKVARPVTAPYERGRLGRAAARSSITPAGQAPSCACVAQVAGGTHALRFAARKTTNCQAARPALRSKSVHVTASISMSAAVAPAVWSRSTGSSRYGAHRPECLCPRPAAAKVPWCYGDRRLTGLPIESHFGSP